MEPDDFDETQFFGADALKPLVAQKPLPPVVPENANPLAAFFRAPGLHVKLPTGGAFLPENEFDPTLAHDLPVYPMRAADELLLKSPDALMSGHAIIGLIKSCVPGIRDPKKISTPDLDVLLLAIRAATFGDTMELEVECPECEQENSFTCSLGAIMSTVTSVPHENPVRMTDDVVVYVRPYTLEIATRVALATFEEARKIQGAEDLPSEERTKIVNECYDNLNRLNMRALASSIVKVVVPGSVVSNPNHIAEFIGNTDRNWIEKIEDRLKAVNAMGIDKTVAAQCAACEHEWKAAIEFNPSTFFAKSS